MRRTGNVTQALLAAACLMLAPLAAPMAAAGPGHAARVEFSVGDVSARDAHGVERRLLKGSRLYAGDTVLTARGRAQIRFVDGGYTSLQPDTEFRIDEYEFDEDDGETSRGFFSLLKGGLRTITGAIGRLNRKAYKLTTPVATIGVRGTEYLAVLGDSLTVHVGEGEIEVCNREACGTFRSFETGYVPDAFSLPQEVDQPPSLSPPQERQNYALNGQYQDPPDAGAEYSRNDDVGPAGVTDVLSPTLPDGQVYTLAASWGAPGFAGSQFEVGFSSPAGELVEAKFNADGALTEYYAPNDGLPLRGSLDVSGAAKPVEFGTAGSVIGWGRWAMGNAVAGDPADPTGRQTVSFSGSSSHHYAIGIPTPDMPSGTASYKLLGATSPTRASGLGSPGRVDSASLEARFDDSMVDLDMKLSVASNSYRVKVPDMTLGGGSGNRFAFSGSAAVMNSTDCVSACSAAVEGFFAGPKAAYAGAGYKVSLPGDAINGALAFEKK